MNLGILLLAQKSLWHRRGTALLITLAIGLSVALLLSVERVRIQAREGFQSTLSGTDLIVGARGNPVQILLSSVFHIGFPTNNIKESTAERIAAFPSVAWTVPLVIGDTHRGFRMIGTDASFFERFQYGRKQPLRIRDGQQFELADEAVIGSQVASRLGYSVGSTLVAAHGAGAISFIEHDDTPFRVVGVLAPTGTPVDRAIYVPMEGYELMHQHFAGAHDHSHGHDHTDPLSARLGAGEKRNISALLVGLKARNLVLQVQRSVNESPAEPLTAVMPGDALLDLWSITRLAESALLFVSGLVVVVGLAGLAANLLIGLRERKREIAILRSVGARPIQILGLVVGEAALLTLGGIVLGGAVAYGGLALASPMLTERLGIAFDPSLPTRVEWIRAGTVLALGTLIGFIPAINAYRTSLAEGMSVKL